MRISQEATPKLEVESMLEKEFQAIRDVIEAGDVFLESVNSARGILNEHYFEGELVGNYLEKLVGNYLKELSEACWYVERGVLKPSYDLLDAIIHIRKAMTEASESRIDDILHI